MKKISVALLLISLFAFATPTAFARESEAGEDRVPDWQKMMRLEVTRTPELEKENETEPSMPKPLPTKFAFRDFLEKAKSMMGKFERKDAPETAKPKEIPQNKFREKVLKSQQRACGLNISAYQKSRQAERKQLLSDCRKNNTELAACKPLLKQFELDTKAKIEAIKSDCKALRDKVLGVTTNANLR